MKLAVIFDMDGLMLDTEGPGMQCWERAGQDLGIEIPEALRFGAIGRTLPDIRLLVQEYFPQGPVDSILERANHHYTEIIESRAPDLKEGLIELLDFLETVEVPHAVATSSRRVQVDHKLASTGLKNRCPHVVCGDEVQRGKPEPDIFLAAAGRLGMMPESCMVLEDSPPGILAAHRAGMRPVMVPELQQPDAALRALTHAVVKDLHQVIPLVQTWMEMEASA